MINGMITINVVQMFDLTGRVALVTGDILHAPCDVHVATSRSEDRRRGSPPQARPRRIPKVNWRHLLSIAGGVAVLLAAERAACQAAPLQHEYQASWMALASPEPISGDVESKSWVKLITFRPERAFVLTAPLTEAGKKVFPVQPVTLDSVSAEQLPTLDMVLLYSGRSVISAATGAHTFQLCILKPGVRNIWGDKTVGRGCRPDIVVKDGEFPRTLQLYGRTLTIAAPVEGRVSVSVTAHPEDLPAAL